MDDLRELEKKHEYLAGRVEEIKTSGLNGFQAQLNQMQDRMNRQELYIKELLQASHADRLNFVESLKNLEISFAKTVTESVKAIELAYKTDKEKQSGFNMLVSQRMAQGVLVVAILWYMAKDLIGGGG